MSARKEGLSTVLPASASKTFGKAQRLSSTEQVPLSRPRTSHEGLCCVMLSQHVCHTPKAGTCYEPRYLVMTITMHIAVSFPEDIFALSKLL